MNIREISVARLKEYENNPRNNDLAVEKVKYSIERFGFLFPVVVDMNYTIVCGHTRVRACRELGIQTVPCIIADELTDEQINLFRLVDNKASEYSDWDFEKLKSELSLVDLTLDKNQLLLDRFELSAEVFDIDAEQAEIKIPSFNFMGVNDKPKEKKPAVSTIYSADASAKSESFAPAASEPETVLVDQPQAYSAPAMPDDSTAEFNSAAPATPAGASTDVPASAAAPTAAEEKPKSKAPQQFNQFRFGDVSFFISPLELERLNTKYQEYIDSGAIYGESFANYLLKGVKNRD